MKFFKGLLICIAVVIAVYIGIALSLVWVVLPPGEPHVATQPSYVVKVTTYFNGYQDVGTGSLIQEDQVLTCFHNIRDARKGNRIVVSFVDGTERVCRVLKTDATNDLALLGIEPVSFFPIPLARKESRKGDVISIGGFPKAGPYAETLGKVVGFRCHEVIRPDTIFLVDDTSIQGMSGGPAIGSDGRQRGVLFGSNVYSNCTGIRAIKRFLGSE